MTPTAPEAALYLDGMSTRQIAAAIGTSKETVRRRLIKAGVKRRDPGFAPHAPARQTHKVVQQLHHLLGTSHRRIVERSGMSLSWWQATRAGVHTPSLAAMEALANAAGYEIILRRRTM